MMTAASGLGPDDVLVAQGDAAAFAADAASVTRAYTWINDHARARAAKFRHDGDRAMFLLGRLMARTLVARALDMAPEQWIWREGPHGRPEIAHPETPIRFNVSHSAGLVLCVLANGRDVGVDIEYLDRRLPDRALVRRYCSPREADVIEAAGDDWGTLFLTCWTLKEAYLKARGLGISVALADMTFELSNGQPPRITFTGSLAGEDDRWWFHLWRPAPRYLAAVAVSAADRKAPHLVMQPFA